MAGIKIQLQNADGRALFMLSGGIDDLANFSPIINTKFDSIYLDLDQVIDINSYGVKSWSQFLVAIKHRNVTYLRCRPNFVKQLNIVINLRKNVEVESFYAPFECSACLIESEVLLLTQDILKSGVENFVTNNLMSINCNRCAGTMEFMDDEFSYFKFITNK